MDLTPEQVDAIADNPSLLGLNLLPCHTQAVQRRIKDVTKIASAGHCIGVHPKNGNHFEQEMSNILYSREIMQKFKSKPIMSATESLSLFLTTTSMDNRPILWLLIPVV